MSCDPKITIRVWSFDGLGSEPSSSIRASTMARPMPLESNLSQWRFVSGSGVWGVFDSDQNGFLRPKNGLVSSMEVGLITASVSEKGFEVKLVNNLGVEKKDEVGLGEGRELLSAIRGASKSKQTNCKIKNRNFKSTQILRTLELNEIKKEE